MKAKVRTFNGTTSPEVTQRETDHRKLAREAAAEGSAPSKEAPVPAMSMSVTALIFSRA